VCLSEAKTSHSQKMWAEVSSCTPHLLHNGLTSSPSRWRCLLRVLYRLRKIVRTLDLFLLKVRNLALVPKLSPEISSRSCLWVSPTPCHFVQCWLANQRLSLFCMSRLETPRAGSGPRNLRAEPVVKEPRWAPGPVWTGAENLASTGIRYPDRPVLSESPYRLSYPGPPPL